MRFKWFTAVAAAATCALVIGACGGDDDTTTPQGQATQSATQSATQTATQSSGTEANGALQQYSQRPTSVGVTEAVGKPIPTGKKVAYITCAAPQCVTFGKELTAAASVLGWTVKTFAPTGGDASATQAAFDQALATKPDALTFSGISTALIQRQLAAATKAGVAVFANSVQEKNVPGLLGSTGAGEWYTKKMQTVGKVIGNTAPAGSNVIVSSIGGFAGQDETFANIKTGMQESCPTCTMKEVLVSLTQIPEAPQILANAARKDPKVKLIVSVLDSVMGKGMNTALKSAGVTGVQYAGATGIEDGVQRVRAGQQVWVETYPIREFAWLNIDMMARHFAGVSITPDEVGGPEVWIVTKDNVPASNTFPVVEDYQAETKQLWGK